MHRVITLIKNTNGKTIGLAGVSIDITERKRIETEMARLDRFDLIGEVAAGIGHEVRNPLTTVRGYLQLLGEKAEFSLYQDQFELLIEELDRANSIITEFLSLAKNKTVKLEKQNLNSLVQKLFPLLQANAFMNDNYIETDLLVVPDMYLDEKEIRQLILNLSRNGLEAMSVGGTLTIRTFVNEEEVVLSVQDQGKGIDKDILNKIGIPFYTTKENGTGIGLAVSNSIAARHNANITIDTSSDGTTFSVRFRREK